MAAACSLRLLFQRRPGLAVPRPRRPPPPAPRCSAPAVCSAPTRRPFNGSRAALTAVDYLIHARSYRPTLMCRFAPLDCLLITLRLACGATRPARRCGIALVWSLGSVGQYIVQTFGLSAGWLPLLQTRCLLLAPSEHSYATLHYVSAMWCELFKLAENRVLCPVKLVGLLLTSKQLMTSFCFHFVDVLLMILVIKLAICIRQNSLT